MAAILDAGFPLVAFLQLCRVYGQALSQIADAEVRLFHLYVHEPLIREGVPGLEMAEEMEGLARDLLPLASPMMDYVHQRFLQHFVEQDVVGHMESELEDEDVDLGRIRVAIAFADLAGYTRFTEEEGEEEALSSVERFVEGVTNTLPEDARVVKTIGDEVMVVGQDVGALVDWAVGFTSLFDERPEPRIGVHYGTTLYRDGDYFGRDVNLDLARGGPRARRRGARERRGDGRAPRLAAPHLRGDRPGEAEGLRGAAHAVPRGAARGMSERALDAARDSGLVRAGEPLLVMVSGRRGLGGSPRHRPPARRVGDRAARELRAARRAPTPTRSSSASSPVAWTCRFTCISVTLPAEGNLQELARDARYSLAEQVADGDYAAAHTASDQAETVLYRLAVSPGSRALHGMAPRRGRLVRPLLEVTRDEVRDYLRARGLEWREDPSNADRRFARARVRHDVLDALRRAVAGGGADDRRDRAPAARRGRGAGRRGGRRARRSWRRPGDLARRPARAPARAPAADPALAGRADARPARSSPSSWRSGHGERSRSTSAAASGRWPSTARSASAAPRTPSRPRPSSSPCPAAPASATGSSRPGWRAPATSRSRTSAPAVTVRAWRDGDRMRPAGLGGSKSLQDLFTDRKVPARAAPHPPGGGVRRRDRLGGGGGGGRALRRRRARAGLGGLAARASPYEGV